MHKLAGIVWGAVVVVAIACSPHPNAPATVTPAAKPDPNDPPMPHLRTGSTPLADGGTLEARMISHQLGKDLEIVRLDLTAPCAASNGTNESVVLVDLGPGRGRGHGVLRDQLPDQHDDVVIARPADQAGKPIAGEIVFARTSCRAAGSRYHFQAAAQPVPDDAQLRAAWATGLANQLDGGGWRISQDAWHTFAANRVLRLAGESRVDANRLGGPSHDSLARLMETTTGIDALQEALQADRELFATVRTAKPSIAIETIHGPALSPHPWAAMRAALGRAAPAEPLATETPAEFYYARFATPSALFHILDHADGWASPMGALLAGRSELRDLSERYQTELGLERSQLARTFGDRVVGQIAIVGSDPYLGEGTDLTLLFAVKNKALFDTTLDAALAKHGAAHGGIAASTIAYDGATIAVARSNDGAVHRYRTQLGAIELVSNSLGATKRVIDTHAAHHASLAAEPDFQYALARGADVPADMLAFIGDKLVAEVVGPRQKILEARRQIALAELSAPPFSALLYGWIYGRSPASANELVDAKLLGRDDLAHHDGAAIAWQPGEAPRSSWGTPAAMTPLIDLPPVVTVTEAERDAYARFASTYEGYWRSYIDPIAIRIAVAADTLAVDMRVLPLIDASDYRKLLEIVGDARIAVRPLGTGARAVVGLGATAIAEASSGLGMFLREAPDLKWLGDWAAIGVDDRTQVAAGILGEDDVPQAPAAASGRDRDRERELLHHFPVYGAVGIRDRAAAALFIIALRKLAEDAVPNVLSWGEVERVRDVAIVRVAAKDDTLDGLELYYAFAGRALVVSLDLPTIRRAVAGLIDSAAPSMATSSVAGAPQLVLDEAGAPEGPLWHVGAWLLEQPAREAAERSSLTAEALLYGAPELADHPDKLRALALNVFGAVPVTADGRMFELGPGGARDPVRGNRFAPAWPELPVAGSPIARLLAAISRARIETSFDLEPGVKDERSLHLRLTLGVH
ncbi:MAG TPA: hypothetical protein VGL61_05110 [Kofleriaceae bacterium]